MRVLFLLCAVARASGALIPHIHVATTVIVTAPCESGSSTDIPTSASYIQAVPASSASSVVRVSSIGTSVKLGPVSSPSSDPSDLSNIVPKFNFTLHYGTNDTSTPASNSQISLQMKFPSVLLEDILSVYSVVCSDTGVAVNFNDEVSYEKSKTEWPNSGDFILFTNHLGNCDAEFERELFLVGGLAFDEATLTVIATAEKSDFQSTAGTMRISFGQNLTLPPHNSTPATPYSNNTTSTTKTKRDLTWDPTYSLSLTTSLPPNTPLASLPPYLFLTAPSTSFTSTATFSGHLDFDFWTFTTKKPYFDLDLGFDASLALSAEITSAMSHDFTYSPSSLSISPISIPDILTLGPALDFAIGALLVADAAVTIMTQTDVGIKDGNVHIDFLDSANTAASGWTPTYAASATVNAEPAVELNPYILLGVELAVDFLGGVLDLSSGINANATLSNVLRAEIGISAGTGTGVTVPSAADASGVCEEGLEYKSDFILG